MSYRVTEFLGDGVGAELSESVHLIADSLPVDIDFEQVDLSLEHRNQHAREVYDEAHASIQSTGIALKHPTVTQNESPNQVLRKLCNFTVIHRPVITIPGVNSNFKGEVNLDIIRVATGGTYQDPGQQIGAEVAVSVRVVERLTVRSAADYAFKLAKRLGTDVTSSSKWTIQRATDGFFEQIVREVSEQNPGIGHKAELFDALLAKIIMKPQDYRVIVTLNEYGDFLSDMACGLVGSLGIGASGSFSFDENENVVLAMFDAAHGTAPDIAGKNLVNPVAILLAFSQLLSHLGETKLGQSLERSIVEELKAGNTTPDLGGKMSTSEFTEHIRDVFLSRIEE